MFGIEKVFGKTPAEQAEKKSVGGFRSPEKTETELLFFEQPLEVGQRWKTEDGNFELVISDQRKGSGRYQIAFHNRKMGFSEVQLKRSEDLKEMLFSDGYNLVSGKVETKDAPAPLPPVQETVAAGTEPQPAQLEQSEQPERFETPSLLDEYLSLSAEIREITETKSAVIGTAIGEILEENADVFGKKGDEFFESRDTYIASINSIVDEENVLSETVEKAGQKITSEELEATKTNHKKLLYLYAELEALKTLVNVYLAEEEHRLEAESLLPIVAPEEKADSLPEKADLSESGVNIVVNMDDYRKRTPSRPEVIPMDSPFIKKAEKKPHTKSEKEVEKAVNAEEKIGKERYEALNQFVENAWKGFRAELEGKKIPKRVWNKIWQEEALPQLKKKLEIFLKERSELEPDEYGAVCDSLIEKISEKK